MTSLSPLDKERPPAYAYHLLKVALASFQKNTSQLDAGQLQQVYRKADTAYELESLVLATPEAMEVMVTQAQLNSALSEVAGRYQTPQEFQRDLQQNGLDESDLRHALQRELIFDSVMQRVGAKSVGVNDLDVRLFYEMHRERFEKPEQRSARHILITINPDYPENTRSAAFARAEQLAKKLTGRTNRFASLARKHSECPSALEDGKLGTVAPGQLYPELDAKLFSMEQGEISEVVETEVGFHILWCKKIIPAKSIPLSKSRLRIEKILEQRQRRNCQKNWLAQLRRNKQNTKEGL